jgi:SAM-dependent methyltransferase
MAELLPQLPTDKMTMLHFAPERFFTRLFRPIFARYETADIERSDVDHQVDLQRLPFADGSYDFVYASHVLEHIRDDMAALGEIARILRPGGVAVLPVPIVAAQTIEYAEPNPLESMHVRAPGPDYFDRYKTAFRSVQAVNSDDYPGRHQVHVIEPDAEGGTTAKRDFVPICYV